MRRLCTADPAFCRAVTSDGRAGFYPSYRFCNMTERAGWALNQQYLAAGGNDPSACAAAGGEAQDPTPARMAGPECEALLRQAGPAGTGTITFTPGARAGGRRRPGAARASWAASSAACSPGSRPRRWRRGWRCGTARGARGPRGGACARWRRRRAPRPAARRGGARPPEAKAGPGGDAGARELDGTEQVEIDGNETYEMAGDGEPLELDGTGDEVFELEGEGEVSGVASGPVSPLTVAGTPKSATTWGDGTR